ncbi:DUF429 domain-containing protein [Baekduia sp. Peel2402]|uniref:DUF429 domain-containing protein n=1 Tax=Baekduia sp. Peel2402 TaxID=3458296 RepID=UPI00403E8862
MALVETPFTRVPDARLLDAMETVSWVGLDAPLGWPEHYTLAIGYYQSFGIWPSWADLSRMRHRVTDLAVRDAVVRACGVRLRPRVVPGDGSGESAWRAAHLLRRLHERTGYEPNRLGVPFARPDGSNRREPGRLVAARGVVEVQPSAALAMWGLPHRRYRAGTRVEPRKAAGLRAAIVSGIEMEAAGWLTLDREVRRRLLASDRALDAFVAALVAMAAASGATLPPTLDQRDAAHFEGWVHLPEPDSLASLAPAGL